MITDKKKVLILSGASYMVEVVETAKTMDLYTIVADNMTMSPAKKCADKSYHCSESDVEKLAEIARKEQIDGVFNVFDDLNTWHALALCKKLNIPIYTAGEKFKSYPGTNRFEEYCQTFNVPLVEVDLFDDFYRLDLVTMEYPVQAPNWVPVKQALQVV